MFLDAEDIIEVKKEDNKIYIRLDQSIIRKLITSFIRANDLKYIDFAFRIDKELAKKEIKDDIELELDSTEGNIEFYIDNYKIILERYGIDVKEINVDDIILLSKLNNYKEYIKENIKIFKQKILEDLDYYYYYFKFGRGNSFESFTKIIIFVGKLYENDLLDKSILNEVRNFLNERKEKLRKIIKRRIEKENHREYIKYLLKLIGGDLEKEFLVYFL